LDRWNIRAGVRLWEQIEQFIQEPSQCDAWMLYATQNSLGSEPCREEFAYALDRAMQARGKAFPVIGVFPSSVDNAMIPAAIRTRLYVSLKDPDWKERICAACEHRDSTIHRASIDPYQITIHPPESSRSDKWTIELRPRAGTWSPTFVAVPVADSENINPSIIRGPAGTVPTGGILHMTATGTSTDGDWWIMSAQDEATPTQSYFLLCTSMPSKIMFGVRDSQPQYLISQLA